MLTIHQASTPNQTDPSSGLAIAGGGPLGAIYELGALRALDESITRIEQELGPVSVYVQFDHAAIVQRGTPNRQGHSPGDG